MLMTSGSAWHLRMAATAAGWEVPCRKAMCNWNGGPHWEQYCPLGQGKVDNVAILDLLEQSKDMRIIMVELDPSRNPPMTPIETARTSKEFLQKQGYTFRA